MRIILLALVLAGCTTANVRTNCDPPPIPANLMQPCEDPERLPDGKQTTLYEQQQRDVEPWGRCARNHALLVKIIKERDTVCQPAPAAKDPNAPWYKRLFGG